MPGCLCVLAGMAVRRIVAAEGRATFLAGAQVDPRRADPDAFLAHATFRVLDGGYCPQMRARLTSCHRLLTREVVASIEADRLTDHFHGRGWRSLRVFDSELAAPQRANCACNWSRLTARLKRAAASSVISMNRIAKPKSAFR